MKLFDGKLNVESTDYVNEDQFVLQGKLVDNTGEFFADEIQENDIIYSLDTFYNLQRFKVISVDNTAGMKFTLTVQWDIPEIDPIEPEVSNGFIIGRRHKDKDTCNITSAELNRVDSLLIQKATSYQFSLGSSVSRNEINELRDRIEEAVFSTDEELI